MAAIPIPNPAIPCSQSGVLKTLSGIDRGKTKRREKKKKIIIRKQKKYERKMGRTDGERGDAITFSKLILQVHGASKDTSKGHVLSENYGFWIGFQGDSEGVVDALKKIHFLGRLASQIELGRRGNIGGRRVPGDGGPRKSSGRN